MKKGNPDKGCNICKYGERWNCKSDIINCKFETNIYYSQEKSSLHTILVKKKIKFKKEKQKNK